MAKRTAAGKAPAKNPMKPAEQRRHFEEAADELGCDEPEERFENALRTIVRHKPKDKLEKPAKKPGG